MVIMRITLSCDHGNSAPIEVLDKLHASQAQTGRHKCVICAYQQGYQLGREKIAEPPIGKLEKCQKGKEAPSNILFDLPESEAEEGHPKCAVCAFNFGFEMGIMESLDSLRGEDAKFLKARIMRYIGDALNRVPDRIKEFLGRPAK
jgi:hypothetical protein